MLLTIYFTLASTEGNKNMTNFSSLSEMDEEDTSLTPNSAFRKFLFQRH